jgi:SWI/SNF-related matrix-associated actin-dependent regulator of chromatin subfamily A-like protein 1
MNLPIEKIATDILKNYEGKNDFILNLKRRLKSSNSFSITRVQSEYILKNKNVEPIVINKLVAIYKSCIEFVKSQVFWEIEGNEIFVQKILSRNDDVLHILVSDVNDSKKSEMIHVSKRCFKKINEVGELNFDGYTRPPKPHQIEAITKLLQHNKFILGDDMGLAKTGSSILAAIKRGFKKILVVCPASLKLNWRKEILFYDDADNISIVDGVDFRVKKWTIVNYDILKNFHDLPQRGVKKDLENLSPIDFHKFDLVIADEAHRLKNSTSNTSKIFMDFAKNIPNIWLLTGTPITNRPMDFYNLLKLCDAPIADNWVFYARRYCAAKQFNRKGTTQKYWVTSGASNLDELRDFSSEFILRRTKKDSIDLPPKTIMPIYLPVHLCHNYNAYLKEYEDWVEEMESIGEKPSVTDHLTKLTKIRQLLSNDKISHTISMAEDYIEEGHKVVIFSCFTNTINTIHEHFGKKSVIVDGSVSKEKRQLAVDKFQTDNKIKVFCGNIIAAGVGLTLTEGTIAIFNDLDWTPANHAQAEDRIYRIGQVNDVNILYPLFDETLDTIMFETLRRKMEIISKVIGDDAIESDISVGKEVINSLKN